MYFEGTASKKNYEKAAEYFQLAADQGEAAAQANLVYLYDNGNGVREDYIKAHEYYLLAADQGDSSTQYNLGNMYENGNGNGVVQDYAKAVEY
ncbi:hypothetical protein BGI36_05595 [Snodgrassella communis]|jgi:uncharacterized protein|nr:hypothetical protein BGI36_05595 [Snodgrassella communis]